MSMYSFTLSIAATTLIFTSATTQSHYAPVYQEVIEVQALPLVQLRRHTVAYLEAVDQEKPKRHRGKWHANADSTRFTYDSDFLLYNRKAVKRPIGQITYRTTIDLKEGKYRYTADSAYFREYRRDRYSRYVPSRRPPVAWEQMLPKFSDKEQRRMFRSLDSRFRSFRGFVQTQTQLSQVSPTVETDNW